MVNRHRFAIGLVLVTLIAADADARGTPEHRDVAPAAPVAISSTSIQIAAALQPEFDDLLRASLTFRSQFRRIAASPWVRVGVAIDATLCSTEFRARTQFRRYQSGLLVVFVTIGPGSHRGQWIAHEFEHILEQLEGSDLGRLATQRTKDVWFSGPAVIETARAIRAGEVVRDELQQARTRH
jgi:hypothetical protein